jgi:hypothetical protein
MRLVIFSVIATLMFASAVAAQDVTLEEVRSYVENELVTSLSQEGKLPYQQRPMQKAIAACLNWDDFCYWDRSVRAFRGGPPEGGVYVWGLGERYSSAEGLLVAHCKVVGRGRGPPRVNVGLST